MKNLNLIFLWSIRFQFSFLGMLLVIPFSGQTQGSEIGDFAVVRSGDATPTLSEGLVWEVFDLGVTPQELPPDANKAGTALVLKAVEQPMESRVDIDFEIPGTPQPVKLGTLILPTTSLTSETVYLQPESEDWFLQRTFVLDVTIADELIVSKTVYSTRSWESLPELPSGYEWKPFLRFDGMTVGGTGPEGEFSMEGEKTTYLLSKNEPQLPDSITQNRTVRLLSPIATPSIEEIRELITQQGLESGFSRERVSETPLVLRSLEDVQAAAERIAKDIPIDEELMIEGVECLLLN